MKLLVHVCHLFFNVYNLDSEDLIKDIDFVFMLCCGATS